MLKNQQQQQQQQQLLVSNKNKNNTEPKITNKMFKVLVKNNITTRATMAAATTPTI